MTDEKVKVDLEFVKPDGTTRPLVREIENIRATLPLGEQRAALGDLDKRIAEETEIAKLELTALRRQHGGMADQLAEAFLSRTRFPGIDLESAAAPDPHGLLTPVAKEARLSLSKERIDLYRLPELRGLATAVAQIWQKRGLPLPTEDIATGENDEYTHFLARWGTIGCPTFELTGGLATALVMTEIRGLLGSDLRLPFGFIGLQMPSPSPLVLKGKDVAWIVVGAVVIKGKRYLSADAGLPDDTVQSLTEYPADDISIADWLKISAAQPSPVEQPDSTVVRAFAVNVLVYINSLHAKPHLAASPKPNGKPDRRSGLPMFWTVGREIKLSNGMLQAARTRLDSKADRKARAIYAMHARFMVRGHWRNQPYGPAHALRRQQWIQPHWKGPETADGLQRLYSLKDEQHQ